MQGKQIKHTLHLFLAPPPPLHKNSPQWHLPQISTHQSQIWNGKFQTTSLSWLMSMVKEGKGYSGKNMSDKYIGGRNKGDILFGYERYIR